MAIIIGTAGGGGGGSSSGFKLGPLPNTFRVTGLDSKAAAEALRDAAVPIGGGTHAAWLAEYEADSTLTIALEYEDAAGNEVAEMQLRDLIAGSSTTYTWYDSATFKGLRGIEGASAYETWESLPGNAGKSEAEFIAAITGTDGTNGTDGADGQVIRQFFRNAETTPLTPTGTALPPAGWTTTPTTPASTEVVWVTETYAADITTTTGSGVWLGVRQGSAKDGADGASGGAFRIVADSAARLAIPNPERVEGLHCYETTTEKTYVLVGGITNTDWEEEPSGGGGTLDGAFRVVGNEAERLAIPTSERFIGLHVYQNDTHETWYLHAAITDADWVLEGKTAYRFVANGTERDAIPDAERKEGLTVYLESNNKSFQLVGGVTNSDWKNVMSLDRTWTGSHRFTQNVRTDGKFVGIGAVDSIDQQAGRVLTANSGTEGDYTWADPTGGGIPDAPSDGKQYARKDAAWDEVDTGLHWTDTAITTSVITLTPDDVPTKWTRFPTAATLVGDVSVTIGRTGVARPEWEGGDTLDITNTRAAGVITIISGAGMNFEGELPGAVLKVQPHENVQLIIRDDKVTISHLHEINDAPHDGREYVRKDGMWEVAAAGGFDTAADYTVTGDWVFDGDVRDTNGQVHIGHNAGETNQGNFSVAIGREAGKTNQGDNSIIISAKGGAVDNTNDGSLQIETDVVTIRHDGDAGGNIRINQVIEPQGLLTNGGVQVTGTGSFVGTGSVPSTGMATGHILTANSAVAGDYEWKASSAVAVAGANFFLANDLAGRMGIAAADLNVGAFCIQVDTQRMYVNLTGNNGNLADWKDWGEFDHTFTGEFRLETDEVHLGKDAGMTTPGTDSVALGRQAGQTNLGDYAVALGFLAGALNQGDNSIVINSSANTVSNTHNNSLTINTGELQMNFNGATDDHLTINKEIDVTDITITAPRLITGVPI